jgi:hypothetical protein
MDACRARQLRQPDECFLHFLFTGSIRSDSSSMIETMRGSFGSSPVYLAL